MYLQLLESIRRLRQIIRKSGKKFMYAENFVYAPAVLKAAEIITAKKSRILYAKGEESLKVLVLQLRVNGIKRAEVLS